MTELQAGNLTLNYVDERRGSANGPPVIFHHGMGGDLSQPLGLLPNLRVNRLVAHDARGHGGSSPLADVADARFELLADDVIRLADELELERFVAAGISMGAGASLNLALRQPDRLEALILARPAWLDRPMEAWKQDLFAAIAQLLETRSLEEAQQLLADSEDFRSLAEEYPAAGVSLLGQLTRRQAHDSTAVLRGFPAVAPSSDASAWERIAVPTLVIGHGDDPFHPLSVAEEFAQLIPGATLATIPSKEQDPAAFISSFEAAVQSFLDSLTGPAR